MTAWRVLVPVKSLTKAKSRLGLSARERSDLAMAMLADVAEALIATPEVAQALVCTADPSVMAPARALGLGVVSTSGISLNADLQQALGKPAGTPTAIVVADLPCLTPVVMSAVLGNAPAAGLGFVSSLDGGTTMLLARDPAALHPRFGQESARAHGRSGIDLAPLSGDAARIDVDSVDSLQAALRIGVGTRTARWAALHAPAAPAGTHRP